jgi:hypothetical protein
MTLIDRRYSVAEGLAVKAPCRAATTANITLSGEQTIDGVAVVTDDRVLVKDQSTGSQNGIYTVSTGAWSRARDFDGALDVVSGTRVFVYSGTINAGIDFYVSTTGTITIDSTSIVFSSILSVAVAAAAAVQASLGLSWTTGDAKLTYKTTADTAWILLDDGSIGDANSSATTRANADTSALFVLLYNAVPALVVQNSAGTPVSRGASAAADFAAHRRLLIPKALGRDLVIAGTGSGLTSRLLGSTFGVESTTLNSTYIPSLTSTANNNISMTVTTTGSVMKNAPATPVTQTGTGVGYDLGGNTPSFGTITSTGTTSNAISVTYTNASPTAVPAVQPGTALNIMVKL